MTPVEPDEQGKTARIEQPAPAATSLSDRSETAEPVGRELASPAPTRVNEQVVHQPETVFFPLAVNIGDGFKFGCGFFLALVLAMLVGFVLLAALFVLTSLFGLNLPITR